MATRSARAGAAIGAGVTAFGGTPAWALASPPPTDLVPAMRMLTQLATVPWYQGLAGVVVLGVCINVLSAGVLRMLTAGWARWTKRQRGGPT